MLKKTVSVLLAIILICAAVPFCAVSVSAAESGEAVGNDYPVLTLDTPYRVNITTGGMEVLLQFTPTESGTYTFHSYNSYDSYGGLYDENMNGITWDDSSYNDWDFLIKNPLEAGKTYYLKVGDYYNEPVSFDVIVNKDPEAATSITLSCGETQTLTKGSSFDVSVLFHPEFAPSEAITWTTTDDSVAAVSESGNVTAVGTGIATITATSANGLTASCVVTVSGDAPVLTLDTPYTANLTTGGMEVLFQFTPAESGTYTFHSYDSADSYGGLYDENMNNIAWDDSSYNDWDFLIKNPLEAGKTYYLKVGDYYNEPVSFDVIVNKDPEAATSITLSCGETQTLTKGSGFDVSVAFHPEFAPPEAITWTTTDSSVATVSENGNVTAVGTGVATITATSAKGLTASCVITVSGDAPVLTLDTPYTANLTTGGMEVLFQFTPAESGTYTFRSNDSADSYGGLYDENMNNIAWDDSSYNDWDFLIKKPLEAGKTYYLKVGDYYNEPVSFDVIVSKEPEATSITLSCGETQTITKGSGFDVYVAFHPEFAPSEAITWTTTDDSVVTVSENGHVTVVGTGVATITATSVNGLTASCVITVPSILVRGDTTGDGVVTIDDATEIQRYLAEFDFDDTTRLLQCGDVTGDNRITIADVTAIQRYLADIENINNIGQRIG